MTHDGTPPTALHPTLARLDELAASLMQNGDVSAVLGLGSAGVEHDRFDEHSDIDFFVVVDGPAEKSRYLGHIEWLSAMGDVAYQFVNDRNGRKVLFQDGLFVEYAVFTAEELRQVPMAGARVVSRRPGTDHDLLAGSGGDPVPAIDTVEFHVNEALTNLFVGLHRELRGERLTASRFIQVFAIDRILALVRLERTEAISGRDPFDATRRVETACPELAVALADLVPGYLHNGEAAQAVLGWLAARFSLDAVITARIATLVEAVARRTGRSGGSDRPA